MHPGGGFKTAAGAQRKRARGRQVLRPAEERDARRALGVSQSAHAEAQSALAEYTYVGPTVTQKTRGYGDIVGPTIRISPGTTLTLTLNNNLPAAGFDTSALQI